MSWFTDLIRKTVVGGSLDPTGKILGISNAGLFNSDAKAAAAKAKAEADAAAKAAEAQAIETNKAAEAQKLALANMQANSAALSNANAETTSQGQLANVVAGGFADAQDTTKKRRIAAPTLADTLGINL